MRVAISGSHSVGKTSLISQVRKIRPATRIIGNHMRRLAEEGFPVGVRTSPSTLAAYLELQAAEEAVMIGPNELLLSDRVLADGVAYILTSIGADSSAWEWRHEDLLLLKAVARYQAARYDLHIFLPIEFEMAELHPLNPSNPELRFSVERHLRQMLSEEWPTRVVELGGTVRIRAERLLELVDSAIF